MQTTTPYVSGGEARSTFVDLYYVIRLSGSFNLQGSNMNGSGGINDYVSNSGRMSGGIEDPVWITVPNQAQVLGGNMVILAGVVAVIVVIGIVAAVVLKKRRRVQSLPPPPTPS